jgi:hypothetical protein
MFHHFKENRNHVKSVVFWVVASCNSEKARRLGGTYI